MRKVLYILGQLSDDDIEWMIANGHTRRVRPGEVLIHEGQPIDGFYIVLEGLFAITAAGAAPDAVPTSVSDAGNPEIARNGVGEVLGEISFVDSRPPLATVTALHDSLVFQLDRDRLHNKLERDAAFAARFYRTIAVFLADRLRNTVAQLGYGAAQPLNEEAHYQGELDERVLDQVHLAGARFERMLKRLTGTL